MLGLNLLLKEEILVIFLIRYLALYNVYSFSDYY